MIRDVIVLLYIKAARLLTRWEPVDDYLAAAEDLMRTAVRRDWRGDWD